MTSGPAPRSPVRGAVILLLGLSSPGFTYDVWILPGQYQLRLEEVTRVFVNNGDAFPESLTLLSQDRVVDARAVSPDGVYPIAEFRADGTSLTFDFRPTASGPHWIVLGTRPRAVRLKPEEFEDYLAEEGLSAIAEMRKERGETGEPAMERYTKWAKALVDVGDERGVGAFWAEAMGQRLEIVPLDHPNRVEPGGSLRLRVLFQGEPLSGVKLTGARASGPAKEISVSTGEGGEAAVTVTVPGRWYVRAIHMIRVEGDAEASWESHWATLSFEVRSPGGSPW